MALNLSAIFRKAGTFFLSSQVLPIILALFTISILFVLFRMKGIELDYQISSVSKKIDGVSLANKELKAKRAKLLSTKKLHRLAKKYNLAPPTQEQIIIIK